MKRMLYASLTFVGVLILATLARGITKDIAGPGAVSLVINLVTLYLLFYLPYKVYKINGNQENEA